MFFFRNSAMIFALLFFFANAARADFANVRLQPDSITDSTQVRLLVDVSFPDRLPLDNVTVSVSGNDISVIGDANQAFNPAFATVEIPLGTFPPGDYEIEYFFNSFATGQQVSGTLSFSVADGSIPVFSRTGIAILPIALVALGLLAIGRAATGFGQFHPLDAGSSELAFARNRRIELKLTSR